MGCCEKCGNLDKSRKKGDRNYYLYGCTARKSGYIAHGITSDVSLKALGCELFGTKGKETIKEFKGQLTIEEVLKNV